VDEVLDLLADLVLVERDHDASEVVEALTDADDPLGLDQRIRALGGEVAAMLGDRQPVAPLATATDRDDALVAGRGDQPEPGAGALDERVGAQRGRVPDRLRARAGVLEGLA